MTEKGHKLTRKQGKRVILQDKIFKKQLFYSLLLTKNSFLCHFLHYILPTHDLRRVLKM